MDFYIVKNGEKTNHEFNSEKEAKSFLLKLATNTIKHKSLLPMAEKYINDYGMLNVGTDEYLINKVGYVRFH